MYTLKPLQEPCPETLANGVIRKRWGFSGKILNQQDVDNLTAKGVDWDEDTMPDGRLKHPKFRMRRIANRAGAIEAANQNPNHRGNKQNQQRRWEEYQRLPEPRPDYFEWASQHSRRELYDCLERIAFNSKRNGERIKAAASILEFSKSRPKQVIENQVVPQEVEVNPENLIKAVSIIFGKDVEYLKQVLQPEPKEIN